MSVNHRARTGGKIEISLFFNMKVYCVFSLESPHPEHKIYHFQYKKRKSPTIISNMQLRDFFSKGIKNEFKTPVVTESSEFDATEVLLYLPYFFG